MKILVAGLSLSLVAASAVGVPSIAAAETVLTAADGGSVSLDGLGILEGNVVEPEGGGTWEYGVSTVVYSNFHHGTRKHGSTAMNGAGNSVKSPDTAGGKKSRASIKKTWAGNTAYYRFVK